MQLTLSVFPKFFQHLLLPELAAMIHDVGLDTCNLVVRDGYWVSEEHMADELPIFMRTMREAGSSVHFATAGFSPERLAADPTPLAILAENGITDFRMDYFREEHGDPRASMDHARAQLATLESLCARYGIRAVYQVHHGTLIPNSWAAWQLVKGCSPRWIGVELDPGNQTFEGIEDWGRAARLLGDYLVALGVKDSTLLQDAARRDEPGKGWQRQWAPLYDGVIDWHAVVRALRDVNFTGTGVFMPFYDEHDPMAMQQKLKREVAYLRRVMREVLAEEVAHA